MAAFRAVRFVAEEFPTSELGTGARPLVERRGIFKERKMPRTRSIKPGFFMNEDLAQIEPLGRLLFAGLPTIADRAGRLEDRPLRIKAFLLPFDDCDIHGLLNALHDGGFILRYENDGSKLIQILTFDKHQSPHIDEPCSVHAPPIGALSSIEDRGSSEEGECEREPKPPKLRPFQMPDARGNPRKQHPKFPALFFSDLELEAIEKKLTRGGLLKENHDHAFMKVEQWFLDTPKGRRAYPSSSNHMRRVIDWGLRAALELQRTSDSAKLANGRLR